MTVHAVEIRSVVRTDCFPWFTDTKVKWKYFRFRWLARLYVWSFNRDNARPTRIYRSTVTNTSKYLGETM